MGSLDIAKSIQKLEDFEKIGKLSKLLKIVQMNLKGSKHSEILANMAKKANGLLPPLEQEYPTT